MNTLVSRGFRVHRISPQRSWRSRPAHRGARTTRLRRPRRPDARSQTTDLPRVKRNIFIRGAGQTFADWPVGSPDRAPKTMWASAEVQPSNQIMISILAFPSASRPHADSHAAVTIRFPEMSRHAGPW